MSQLSPGVTIYLRRQCTSLLISAQSLRSVKQKNNQRLLQRRGLLTATESKMLLPLCTEPKLKGVFIWKLASLRSLESFEGQWKKENTCWQSQTSAPSYKHQAQYASQCVYDWGVFHFVRQRTKERMQVLKNGTSLGLQLPSWTTRPCSYTSNRYNWFLYWWKHALCSKKCILKGVLRFPEEGRGGKWSNYFFP